MRRPGKDACKIMVAMCLAAILAVSAGAQEKGAAPAPISISGVYPHLAVFNEYGECGIGAVVPWAGKLWYMTYPPHMPKGGNDKLYAVDENWKLETLPESVGGTNAGRMIHRESNQLIIGPYFISAEGKVRAVDLKKMPGRITAVARHLTDPANKAYFMGMEEEFYEVNVKTLEFASIKKPDLPGNHAKGGYTAQGRFVFSNNGKGGVLAEWDGKNWTVVHQTNFVEVTGPGGIYGAATDDDPLWATGWDKRSVILKLLDKGKWHTYRLPKADYSYGADHGWYTEWPRIRDVGRDKLLMDMFGMLYDFPKTFCAEATGGIRPLSTHLRMIVDFCEWKGKIAFVSDDTSIMQNSLAGQSQSNLWFVNPDDLKKFGKPAGWGGPWVEDDVKADTPSDPFFCAGFSKRVLHLSHHSADAVKVFIELDRTGKGAWEAYQTIGVPPNGYIFHLIPPDVQAEWMRLKTDVDAKQVTAYFHFSSADRSMDEAIVQSVANTIAAAGKPASSATPAVGARSEGVIRPRGDNLRTMNFLADQIGADGKAAGEGYYEIGEDMKLRRVDDAKSVAYMKDKASVKGAGFKVDEASVIVTDSKTKQNYRLPKSDPIFDKAGPSGWPRALREVVTERNLLNACGTFYQVPREDAGGYRLMKPVATHNRLIQDFCTWRGMLALTGALAGAANDGHLIASDDGKAGLWFGVVDDLWSFGKPRGIGGPWKKTAVKSGEPSDPYLMTNYDKKMLELSHDASAEVEFKIEVDVVDSMDKAIWSVYKTIKVPPRETMRHEFPDGYNAHWARVTTNRDCAATAWFIYE